MLNVLAGAQETARSPLDHPRLTPPSGLRHIAAVIVAAAVVGVEETGIGAVGALSMTTVTGTGLPLGLALKRGDIGIGMIVTENVITGISMEMPARGTQEMIAMFVTAKVVPNPREHHMSPHR